MNRKPGDWTCPSCQHLNFSRRDTCQRCSDARPGGGVGGGSRGDGADYGSYGSRGGGSFGFGSGYGSGGGGGGGGDYGRSYGGSFGFGGSSDSGVRPGDWYCSAGGCGAHNFASRSSCFKCGAFKEESASGGGGLSGGYDGGSRGSRGSFGFGSSYSAGVGPGGGVGSRQGWKSGDWICGRTGCNEHNFASRMECYRCSAPRESGDSYNPGWLCTEHWSHYEEKVEVFRFHGVYQDEVAFIFPRCLSLTIGLISSLRPHQVLRCDWTEASGLLT